MQEEIWKNVVGYEGLYMVSNFGRVKSLPRIDSNGHRINGRILKNNRNVKSGYMVVNLHKDGDGGKTRTVHRLVATAFIPNPDGLPQVGHKDETRTNNHVNNLYWTTNLENSNMPLRRVRSSVANARPCSELVKEQIRQIMENKRGRNFMCDNIKFESATSLAKYLRIPLTTLLHYVNGERKMPDYLAGKIIEIERMVE